MEPLDHEHMIIPKPLAVVDTAAVCIIWLLYDRHSASLLICTLVASTYVLAYIRRPTIAISEIALFYVSISIWDVLTGRIPHDRVHPRLDMNHQCPICENPPDVNQITGIADVIAYIFVIVPLLASIVATKISAIVVGPLLYVGFPFREKDFRALSFEARAKYRSSFKQITLFLAVIGLALFLGKIVVYSYWNQLAEFWQGNAFLSIFD